MDTVPPLPFTKEQFIFHLSPMLRLNVSFEETVGFMFIAGIIDLGISILDSI